MAIDEDVIAVADEVIIQEKKECPMNFANKQQARHHFTCYCFKHFFPSFLLVRRFGKMI